MKIAIIHYDDSLSPGGINTNIRETFLGLTKRGVEAHIIQPHRGGNSELSRNPNFHGLTCNNLKPPFNLSRTFIRELQSKLQQIKPDVVHVHSHMNLLSHSIIRSIRRNSPHQKVVFSPHFDIAISSRLARPFFSLFNRTIGKSTLNRVDYLIFNSDFERNAYCRMVGGFSEQFKNIPPGINLIGHEVEKVWDSELNILFYGHFVHRKRVDRALNLFRKICDSPSLSDVKMRFIICGQGPEGDRIMKLSRLLNLENHVDWRPFLPREELLQLITEANYTILLSDSEAYGISVAESLALGTPVIGSKLAALSEFQSTPGAFLFENPEDFDHIARSISSHRGQKIVIGPVGHNIISNEQSVEHHLSLYRTIINENHSI